VSARSRVVTVALALVFLAAPLAAQAQPTQGKT